MTTYKQRIWPLYTTLCSAKNLIFKFLALLFSNELTALYTLLAILFVASLAYIIVKAVIQSRKAGYFSSVWIALVQTFEFALVFESNGRLGREFDSISVIVHRKLPVNHCIRDIAWWLLDGCVISMATRKRSGSIARSAEWGTTFWTAFWTVVSVLLQTLSKTFERQPWALLCTKKWHTLCSVFFCSTYYYLLKPNYHWKGTG